MHVALRFMDMQLYFNINIKRNGNDAMGENKEIKGRIFNIQHFSVNDGPGIRTVVFFKGCPLRCRWCGNPESQKVELELAWTQDKCLHCQNCVLQTKKKIHFDDQDKLCFAKVKLDAEQTENICPSGALHLIGRYKTVDEVWSEVAKDNLFYQNSHGGMTLSGGEPLWQPEFALALLQKAHSAGIHCAIETSGFAPWHVLKEVAAQLDYIFFDIKSLNRKKHIEQTGVDNTLILNNFEKLVRTYPDKTIHVRTPVIPGFNDTADDINDILNFLDAYPQVKYELLQYHRYGVGKYETLRRIYNMPDVKISDEFMAKLRQTAKVRRNYEYKISQSRKLS